MKILKKLRNPSFSFILASLVLFVSCSQYEIRNRAFDYAVFETYKNSPVFDKIYERVKADSFKLRADSDLELKK